MLDSFSKWSAIQRLFLFALVFLYYSFVWQQCYGKCSMHRWVFCLWKTLWKTSQPLISFISTSLFYTHIFCLYFIRRCAFAHITRNIFAFGIWRYWYLFVNWFKKYCQSLVAGNKALVIAIFKNIWKKKYYFPFFIISFNLSFKMIKRMPRRMWVVVVNMYLDLLYIFTWCDNAHGVIHIFVS